MLTKNTIQIIEKLIKKLTEVRDRVEKHKNYYYNPKESSWNCGDGLDCAIDLLKKEIYGEVN